MDTSVLELVSLDSGGESSVAEMAPAAVENGTNGAVKPFVSAHSCFLRKRWESVKTHVQRRRKLAVWLAVFLVSGIAANVFFKLELNAMYNYPLYTSQLNPIILAILFGIGLNVEIRRDDAVDWSRVLDFPMWKLLVVSVLDVTANVMELKSSDGMGKDAGPLSMLLAQCVIPFTMLFSVCFLRRRYTVLQVLGAAVILGGVLAVVLPEVRASKSALYTAVYAASRMPTSLNKVIKEHLFARHALTVLFVGYWEQTFNVVVGALAMLFCYPVVQGVELREVPTILARGTWCALGRNSVPGDDCARAPWLIPLFNLSALVWMGATLAVVKHGSATVAFLASAVLIPLSDFLFASRAIFGANAKVFRWYDFLGLVIILAGMLAYAVGSVLQDKRRQLVTVQTADNDDGDDRNGDVTGGGEDGEKEDEDEAGADGETHPLFVSSRS